ncbi:MAG: ParB/RepB/Spo0J family partition protein [Phycisphaerales bacterium]|nr:ParB/RepB/Spo0J family partition protein [Phycisphaerales bacterium]
MNVQVNLSELTASRINPRRVKPERDAHRRLVASIRAHGLLEPLIVRRTDEGGYRVIAGNRRLAALRDVHRGDRNAKVACIVRGDVNCDEAATISLAENFVREPMHPLDEAEAFARLASVDCKGVKTIAAEFGVSETYVRQRMSLADLIEEVKAAMRAGQIGVGIAEEFAAVPTSKQAELWKQTHGKPRDARQVRALIEHEWIEGKHARFDITTLEPGAVTHDLFGGEMLIARDAFMRAQAEALEAEREKLIDEGWKEVVVAPRGVADDRLMTMPAAKMIYDEATTKRMKALREKRDKLERSSPKTEKAERALSARLDALDTEEAKIIAEHPGRYSEATKAAGTVFLILSADGSVQQECRVPCKGTAGSESENTGGVASVGGNDGRDTPPTSDDLSDRQLAEVYMHEAIAVREAVAKDRIVRKRLMVLALHDKIAIDAVAVRFGSNGIGRFAEQREGFASQAYQAQQDRRRAIDPFADAQVVDEAEGYTRVKTVPEKELDVLLGVLIVEAITGHTNRLAPLVELLREELGVSLRTHWTPDRAWLNGYTKAQLAHLLGELKGPTWGKVAMQKKKSELVYELAGLFRTAKDDPASLNDQALAERVNTWVPAVMKGSKAKSLATATAAA